MDHRKKRLLFQSRHRGMNENDLLIGSFAAAHLPDMGEAEMDEFESLLAELDIDLFGWITAQRDVPEHRQTPLMQKIQAFVQGFVKRD
ncbi:MAG: succinate dehydrogenase assembly factor 2 [Alphaproteobacteria bacterium]|nr:succinate dehydrogenase assembly factor 2 [Alphaproteobacteria bacterium]